MPDNGMVEHITLMRGASLILTTILPKFSDSIFRDFAVHGIFNSLPSVIREEPMDDEVIRSFTTSADRLKTLCQTSTEREYWSCTMRCIHLVTVCSVEGKQIPLLRSSRVANCFIPLACKEFSCLFMMPSTFTSEDFLAFTSSENFTARLLIIHMFLLDYILGRSCITLLDRQKWIGRKKVVIEWTKNLAKVLPGDYQKFIDWPLKYCESLTHQDSRHLLTP